MSDASQSNGLEIAVIGMAGRFPGAPDMRRLWENLCHGVESIDFFSGEGLPAQHTSEETRHHPDYVGAAGVVEGEDLFDASFFGFTPREAEILDPQHRLFLECAWEALEDAGFDPQSDPRPVGVYAGTKLNTYLLNLYSNPELIEAVGAFQAVLANDKDYLATRVSYKLDLTGPSVVVQTACSTSLATVHLACQGLLAGECDMALAGGVSIGLPQRAGYRYTEGGILSPDGHCRAFDARAQGTVGGNGIGVVVLKRLRDAIEDGDRIYAVIKGSAMNNDGALKTGYTAPSLEGQAKVIRAAQELAEVDPATITYIEAHGTATALGDPIEVGALTRAFRRHTDRKGFCALGSIKTNIGHLDTAAGIAGLIKTVLMLHHRKMVPSLHFEAPNPEIDFAGSPFYVTSHLADWDLPDGGLRRAGVSSFGIGGTNVHVVLEEAPTQVPASDSHGWELLVLSARTRTALETVTRNLADHLEAHPEQNLADVAWTLRAGRRRFEQRRTLVCRDRGEAVALLRSLDPERVFTRHQEPCDRPVAFLFSGQGTQYPGMGRELYAGEPSFRREIDRCAEILRPYLGFDLSSLLYPQGGDPVENARRLQDTAVAQPALFATEYALARLWMEWGIRPEVMLGHSVGEYVAACLAGVFTLEDALRLVAARGRRMQEMPAGAMLAVSLSEEELSPELIDGLSLAAVNGPRDCVAAGPATAIDSLRQRLEARGVSCRPLHTSHAFHSTMMDPALQPFATDLLGVRLAPPQLPFFSNLSGTLIRWEEAIDPGYWVRHLRGTVRFGESLGELWQEPNRILLEIGPGRTLRTLAKQHPACPRDGVVLSSLPSARDDGFDQAFLISTAGRLWLAGASLDWDAFQAREGRRRVSLPTYPFERRRHWVERRLWLGAPVESGGEAAAAAEPVAPPVAEAGVSRPHVETDYVPPRTDEEREIARLWEMHLGIQPVGVHDNFFELGGGSLLATRLAADLRGVLRVELTLREMLDNPTVARLATLLAERRRGSERVDEALPVELIPDPANASQPFPLTEVQQAYWVGRNAAIELGNVATHFYKEIELAGLDLARFERALQRVIDRQPMLRGIVLPDGRQQILSEVPPYRIPVIDLTGDSAAEVETSLAQVRERMSHQVLPTDRWPLFEVAACQLEGGLTRLHLSFDFLLGDAWSLQLLLVELGRLYHDPEGELPALEITFRDYVLAEERLKESAAYERALVYWRSRLETLPPAPELPLAKRLAEVERPRFVRRHAHLEAVLWERLKVRAGKAGLSASGLLLAAYSEVLAAWSARPSFTLSLTLFNRLPLHPQVNALIGDFTSVVLLEVDTSGHEGFEARAQRLQRRLWEDLDHRYVSGVRVLRELARAQGHPGGVTVPFVFTSLLGLDATGAQGLPEMPSRQGEEIGGSQVYSISQTPQVLLDHQADEVRGALLVDWDVVDEAFPPGMIDEMFAAYMRLLHRLAEREEAWRRPERDLLTAEQLAERLVANSTSGPLPDRTLHALFEERAAREPERPAVFAPDRTLTYGELDALATRLAHRLRGRGARPNGLVAVILEKGWEQVVAVLAVLKSGAAYLPIDPALPSERIHHLLLQGEARLALTVPEVDRSLDWPEEVERLDVGAEDLAEPVAPLAPLAGLDDLAYVIFTSGSTGVPKGVMIDHRGAANTILDVNERFGVGPDDRVLAVSALNFDLSVYDIFGLLAAGGAVVLPSTEGLRDPAHWAERMRSAGVTLWNSVPALLEMLVEHAAGRSDVLPRGLRVVLLSGDWIPVGLPGRLRDLVPAAEVISLGGATEASIWSILHPVVPEDALRSSIPYGRPMRNQTFHVLDERLEPRPVWVPGDLYIGGIGLALGYWRDEERTRASFPTHPGRGERLYLTGDRGRYLPGGEIEFLGREDFQVKIHGHRIELGEIEATLAQHPAVESCVAHVVGERTGRRLAVWYVLRAGAAAGAEELAEFLRHKLPAYMVPAAFVPIERLPLTANGKLDRRALPAVESAPEAERSLAPRNAIEEILCGICAEVLRLDRVGPFDDFFTLGGHSLLATALLVRVREALHVELPLRQVFDSPSMSGLAAAIERERKAEAGIEVPPVVPVPREIDLPLSFAQQRLWFIKQLVPDSPLYNVHVGVRSIGRLDLRALGRTLDEVIARHEVLRSTFPEVEGRAVQRFTPPAPVPLPLIDLSGLPETAREREAAALTGREVLVPYDFVHGPLVRARLLRLGPSDHIVLFLTHHIIWDDWSQGILMREMSALYRAFAAGQPSPLPPLPVQYADFAYWQRQWLESEVKNHHLEYWRRKLAGVPHMLELSTDRPRPAVQSFRGRGLSRVLAADLTAGVRTLGSRRESTLFMILAAAFKVLLFRYSGQSDIAVGTLTGNRNRPEIENLIGFFVNTIALRSDLAGDPSFEELLGRVRETALQAYDHQDLPFENLIESLKLPRDLGYNPLTQVVFNHFSAGRQTVELPDLTLREVGTEPGWAPFDLSLTISGERPGLVCEVAYATDLYDEVTMSRLLRHWETLLQAIVEQPGRPLSELPLLTAGERVQLLLEWNDTANDFPREQPVHRLFAAEAERNPDAIAVLDGDTSLSYGELEVRANQLAHYLRRLGVGPEDRVGLCVERSAEMIIAMLGVLKAGGAYVPLDPSYPRERLLLMLEDTGMSVVVARERWLSVLPEIAVRTVLLDRDAAEIARCSRSAPAEEITAENLAYIMYTSGSTGRPKGVAIVHRGIVRLVKGGEYARYAPDEVILHLAPANFDASTAEIWGALLNGGRVAIFGSTTPTAEDLEAALHRHGVTTLFLTTGLFHQIVEVGIEVLRPVRQLLAGGDVISAPHVRRVLEELPELRFIHCYGPTESTTFTSCYRVRTPSQAVNSVSIGRPIGNTRVVLLDGRLHPVPIGIVGSLYVAGDGLARGYWGRPVATAEAFLPDPTSPEPGGRLYRTGDRARYLADGRIEFLGRLDRQVKIRGFRIELDEIETVLRQHPAVREAVAVVREDSPGTKRLVGYAVLRDEAAKPDLPLFLRDHLPEYMIPSSILILDALPLDPNGKVDRKALPDHRAGSEDQDAGPRTAVERILVEIWCRALGRDRVGIHEGFFELGGDSILSIQVIARAREAGILLTPNQVFQHQTIAQLATVARLADGNILEAEQGPVAGPVPLTPIQQWFFEADLRDSHHFNHALLLQAQHPLDTAALAAAVRLLIEHHDALRLRFTIDPGGSYQTVEPPGHSPLPFTRIDLGPLPGALRRPALEAASAALQVSLDLARGPLLRVALFALGDEEPCRLLIIAHHLVVDGVSWRILLDELQESYVRLAAGAPAPLPTQTTSFTRWASLLAEHARSEEMRADSGFWLGSAGDLDNGDLWDELPADFPAGENLQALADTVVVALDPEQTRRLIEEMQAASGARIDEALLTAFGLTLARWTGRRRFWIHLESHGREELAEGVDLSRTVGWLTSVFPLALEVEAGADLGTALKVMKEQLRAVPRRGIAYGLLRYLSDDPEVRARLSARPVPELCFNYLGRFDQTLGTGLLGLAPESCGPARSARGQRLHGIEIDSLIANGRLQVTWTYSTARHHRETIESLASLFLENVEKLLHHCCSFETSGLTLSDFPEARLSQDELDNILSQLG